MKPLFPFNLTHKYSFFQPFFRRKNVNLKPELLKFKIHYIFTKQLRSQFLADSSVRIDNVEIPNVEGDDVETNSSVRCLQTLDAL